MNLTMLLEMAASADSTRIALGRRDAGLTYPQLLARAVAVGHHLRESGSAAVALLDENNDATPILLFGAAAAGVPFAPLNFRLTDEQLAAAVRRLGSVILAAGEHFAGRVPATLVNEVMPASALPGVSAHVELPVVDPESAAVLLATSGTTGTPKEAVLRHRHLVSYIIGTVEFFSADEDEAILVAVPNYHVAGITSVLSSVYSGRRMVQLPQFTAEAWVESAAREEVTHAMVVPTMLARVLDVLDQRGETLPALRHLSYGGGRMPVAVIERGLSLLPHVDFVNAYGLTETSSTIAVLGPEDHREAMSTDDPAVRARLGSVGRPLPTVEVEVRDAGGRAVPAGVSGEIYVRGEQVSGEYRTHSALDPDGWYPTRDHGHLDQAGFLYVGGRADDVIVRGGENMSPGEIEDVLQAHPDVHDAAVVGVSDVEWGERIEAVVVAEPGTAPVAAELQEWVRAHLRSSKVPTRVHFWDELPYNETGKLLRRSIVHELSRVEATS